MNLQCRAEVGFGYKAGPQIARVVTEDWCSREVYCAACDSSRLSQSRTNTQAIDFLCASCEESFQLKSLKNWIPKKVVDAGYDAMIRAIREDRTPNLLLLQYSRDWLVQNLLLVPRMFFTESIIEKRKPLSAQARRAGWVGCNILLSEIPPDGKIPIVSGGSALPKERVRSEFARVRRLGELAPSLRGWTVEVLRLVRRLGKARFSLSELYAFEGELQTAHPHNQNVRPKIRQQLQVLRDLGFLEFTIPGNYSLKTSG